MFEIIQTQLHDRQRRIRPAGYQPLRFLAVNHLIEQTGDPVRFIFPAEIGDNAGEQHRTAVLIKYNLAAAADPNPLAPLIERAVFDVVRSGTAVQNDLIGF